MFKHLVALIALPLLACSVPRSGRERAGAKLQNGKEAEKVAAAVALADLGPCASRQSPRSSPPCRAKAKTCGSTPHSPSARSAPPRSNR